MENFDTLRGVPCLDLGQEARSCVERTGLQPDDADRHFADGLGRLSMLAFRQGTGRQ